MDNESIGNTKILYENIWRAIMSYGISIADN